MYLTSTSFDDIFPMSVWYFVLNNNEVFNVVLVKLRCQTEDIYQKLEVYLKFYLKERKRGHNNHLNTHLIHLLLVRTLVFVFPHFLFFFL